MVDRRIAIPIDGPDYGAPSMDDPITRLPRNRAEAWVQVTPERQLSLLARVRYFGQSYDMGNGAIADPSCPAGSTPLVKCVGYTTVEATATWQISRKYLGVARVDDLFDVRPETRPGYHTAGRVVTVIFQGQWD